MIRALLLAALVVACVPGWPPPAWPQSAESQRELQTIEQARRNLDARRPDPLLHVVPVFRSYTQLLTVLAWSTDPAALEAEYRAWTRTGQLDTLRALTGLARAIAEQKVTTRPMDADILGAFRAAVAELERAADGLTPSDTDLPRARAALWKLRFVESAASTERIAALEAAVTALDARLVRAREVEAIKGALRHAITSGVADPAVEQRIAALPPESRDAVERYRIQEEEARVRELGRLREEEQAREQALARRRAIEHAIRLRRQEIETGKPDPAAEAQRTRDPELRRAVELWEIDYRRTLSAKPSDAREAPRPPDPPPAEAPPPERDPRASGPRGEATARECTRLAADQTDYLAHVSPRERPPAFNAAYYRCMYERVDDADRNEDYRLLMRIASDQVNGVDRRSVCQDLLADADRRSPPRPGHTSRAALRCLAGE